MALKDMFGNNPTPKQEEQAPRTFTIGALNIYRIDPATLDVVVAGKLEGTLKVGDIVTITNIGDDNDQPRTAAVYAMEIANRERVFEATDQPVAIWLEDALQLGMKKGTVLHDGTATKETIYKQYVSTLGDVFVGEQEGVLTDADVAVMTAADMVEVWRVFQWYCNVNAENETEEQHAENIKKIERLVMTTRDKLLASKELAVVYSPVTNEPYLFSQTVKQDDGGYYVSAPMIFVSPMAFAERLQARFDDANQFELRTITAGEDGNGIAQFFADTFYLNGATGVHLVSEQTSIAAPGVVAPEDYSDLEPQDVPVTNPDVMRWILQLGQLGEPTTEESQLIHSLYYRFMAQAMPKARFLTPVKAAVDKEEAQLQFGDDRPMKIAVLPGKAEKEAVVFYTDWKRLREVYDEEWSALIQVLSQVTPAFDVAVNPTSHPAIGCYITEELFNRMKEVEDK